MRKLTLLLLLVPFCCTLSVGCGSNEPKIIIQDESYDEAAEAALYEGDDEVTNE